MTKLVALSFAIEEANSYLKGAMGDEETKNALDMVYALEGLEDDIIKFLDKKITAVELYERLEK